MREARPPHHLQPECNTDDGGPEQCGSRAVLHLPRRVEEPGPPSDLQRSLPHLNLTDLPDAAGAIGICRRRGLGKIRHLAVAELWVQGKVRARDCILKKVQGRQHPADITTKHVDAQLLHLHLWHLNLRS